MPKTFTAEQLRDQTLAMVKEHPEGIKASAIRIALLGNTNDLDEERRRHQRLGHALRSLAQGKFVMKKGNLWNPVHDRPSPEIGDLPVRRGRKTGSKNHSSNGDLKAYIIRDIRAKLAELEAL